MCRSTYFIAAVIVLGAIGRGHAQIKEPENGPELAQLLYDKFRLQCGLNREKNIFSVVFGEGVIDKNVSPAFDRIINIATVSSLEFRSSKVTAEMLKKLSNLPNLKYLDVPNAGLRDNDLADLENLTQLKRLNLAGNPITDAGLIHLKPLQQLKFLVLDRTKITGSGFKHLPPMQKLHYLSLHDTPVTNESMAVIGKLDSLQILTISRTPISNDGIKQLTGLFRLQELTTDTGVTDEFRKEHVKAQAAAEKKGLLPKNHLQLRVIIPPKPQQPKHKPARSDIT